MASWANLKEQGNEAYKVSKIEEAVEFYTKALALTDVPAGDRATILCNRAQCFLKLNKNTEAVEDCTASLTHAPDNVKALFRRLAGQRARCAKRSCGGLKCGPAV